MKKNTSNWNCEECIHSMQETLDDVACCNCCEDGSFFQRYFAEELDDDDWKCCRCKCIDMDTEDKIYCCKNCRDYDHFIPVNEEMELYPE